jgi:hypothetical protein
MIFPSDVYLNEVIVRVYYSEKTKDIQLPTVCKKYMMLKLREELASFDEKVMSASRLVLLKRDVFAEWHVMMGNLSRLTLEELYKILSPKRVVE